MKPLKHIIKSMGMNNNISDLLKKKSITSLTFGVADGDGLFVQAEQAIQTGPGNNRTMMRHQTVGADPSECIESLIRLADHCLELQPRIIEQPAKKIVPIGGN